MVSTAWTDKSRARDKGRVAPLISRPSLRATGFMLAALMVFLTVDALIYPTAPFDIWLIQKIQRIDLPLLEPLMAFINELTGSTWAIILWAATFLVFAVARWWLPAMATLTLPFGGLVNEIISEYLVGRTRPDGSFLVRKISGTEAASFPSGHVMGAVKLYGLIFVVARRIEQRALRLVVQGASLAVIATTGFARIWDGAHWPSDVLAAYTLGGLLLIMLIAVYQRIDAAAGDLPFIHAGYVPHDETQPHAHALTSTVVFQGDRVAKIYSPGFVPRALYWLSFQAQFPYIENRHALEAARYRRNLVSLLTEFWYGSSRVARITDIELSAGRYAVVSELVDGHKPVDRDAAREFLVDLRQRFEDAGLPTWQIDPRQPRAVDNLLQRADGTYAIVDLESGLVSPLASLRTWKRALRRGAVPMFDEVFFDLTRAYIESEAAAMRAARGDAWFNELLATLDAAETETSRWHASEPRLWSRLIRAGWHGFYIKRWPAMIQARTAAGQDRAMEWMSLAVANWQDEGRISAQEAVELRRQMTTAEFQAVIPHFGAHLVMSVVLRFPLGSIARAGWSLWLLVSATARLMTRRIDRQTWGLTASIHSPLVIALAAIPGFGAFAYLAAKPIRSNRLLVRVATDAIMQKLPWHLYERTGTRRFVARPVGRYAHQQPDFGRSGEDRVVGVSEDWSEWPSLVVQPEVNVPVALAPVPIYALAPVSMELHQSITCD